MSEVDFAQRISFTIRGVSIGNYFRLWSVITMVLFDSSERRWPKHRPPKEQVRVSSPTACMQIGLGGSREAGMFRSLPKRAIAWLVGILGPPPPPPRRHFSKMWDARVRQRLPLAVTAPGATKNAAA
jgi:hypothetical protein